MAGDDVPRVSACSAITPPQQDETASTTGSDSGGSPMGTFSDMQQVDCESCAEGSDLASWDVSEPGDEEPCSYTYSESLGSEADAALGSRAVPAGEAEHGLDGHWEVDPEYASALPGEWLRLHIDEDDLMNADGATFELERLAGGAVLGDKTFQRIGCRLLMFAASGDFASFRQAR